MIFLAYEPHLAARTQVVDITQFGPAIAYLGMSPCPVPECGSFGHIHMHSVPQRFLVPLLNIPLPWTYWVHWVSRRCDHATRLTKAESDQMLRASASLPDKETMNGWLTDFRSELRACRPDNPDASETWLAQLWAAIDEAEQIPEEHSEYFKRACMAGLMSELLGWSLSMERRGYKVDDTSSSDRTLTLRRRP